MQVKVRNKRKIRETTILMKMRLLKWNRVTRSIEEEIVKGKLVKMTK